MIELVPASPVHIGPVANRMREWDRREVAAFGRTPKQALRLGLTASLWSLTVMIDGRPEGILGLCPISMISGRGQPWMLATDEVYRHPRGFASLWRDTFGRMFRDCPHLENWVGAGNAKAITFLRHAGFEIGQDVLQVGGLEMVRFSSHERMQDRPIDRPNLR